jgi:geranylgeranyl pyrophosphate synthase
MKPENYLKALQVEDKEIAEYLLKTDEELQPYLLRIAGKAPKTYPLYEGVHLQIATGRRRLRAAFCTTCCSLFNGLPGQAFYFASAIEHLQNSMLIHDDITKGEGSGHQSVWQRFGIAQGINIGDVFISLSALAIIDSPYSDNLKLKLLELFCEQGFETAEGLNLDINLRINNSPTMNEYYKCIKKKTGSFLAMAAKGGAIIGGANEEMIRLINNYAVLAGVVYEVSEEILDVGDFPGRFRGIYIKEGRRTLLSIYAAENAPAKEAKKLFSILNKKAAATTDKDIVWVCELYKKTGAVDYGETVVKKISKNSLRHLSKIPESEAKKKLVRISKYYSQRL